MPPPLDSLTDRPLGILVVTREEMAAVAHHLGLADVGEASDRVVTGCVGVTELALARSGVGPERARRAAEDLVAGTDCRGVVIAGFASGLREGVLPGDTVLATAVLDGPRAVRRQQSARTAGGPPDAVAEGRHLPSMELLTIARRAMLDSSWGHMGTLVTWPQPLYSAEQKGDLAGAVPGVVAADFQTASAVAACEEAGVPWVAVCAITDGIDDDIPLKLMGYVDANTGELNGKRVMRAALWRPWKAPALAGLRRRSARGSEHLADFLAQMVREMDATDED